MSEVRFREGMDMEVMVRVQVAEAPLFDLQNTILIEFFLLFQSIFYFYLFIFSTQKLKTLKTMNFSDFITAQYKYKISEEVTHEVEFMHWLEHINFRDMQLFATELKKYIDKQLNTHPYHAVIEVKNVFTTTTFKIYVKGEIMKLAQGTFTQLVSDTEEIKIDFVSYKTCTLSHHIDMMVNRACASLRENMLKKWKLQKDYTRGII